MREILNKKRKNLKGRKGKLREKGITLIALVVTIIILLIIAGVTLNIALSENGLFDKAKQSAERAKDVTEDEQVKVAITDALVAGAGTLSTDNVKEGLKSVFGEEKVNDTTFSGTGPWTFVGDRKTYTIGEGGTVEEVKPKTVADLKAGEWVKYESEKAEEGYIYCRVLYDTEYNTVNETNYGTQIISVDTLGDGITIGSNEKTEMLNVIESLQNVFGMLDSKCDEYKDFKNTTFSIRCVGGDPKGACLPRKASHQCERACYFKEKWPDIVTDGKIEQKFFREDNYYKTDFDQMTKLDLLEPENNRTYWVSSFVDSTYPSSYITLGFFRT